MTITNTIRQQLGGFRFEAMTGMKLALAHGPEGDSRGALSFHLPARFAKDGVNYVKVSLMTDDTYTIEFTKIGPRPSWKALVAGKTQKTTVVATKSLVHGDQLERIVGGTLGLDTRL